MLVNKNILKDILHLSLSQIETIRLPDQGHMTSKVLDSGLESSFILLQR